MAARGVTRHVALARPQLRSKGDLQEPLQASAAQAARGPGLRTAVGALVLLVLLLLLLGRLGGGAVGGRGQGEARAKAGARPSGVPQRGPSELPDRELFDLPGSSFWDSAVDWARKKLKRETRPCASVYLMYDAPRTGKIKAWYHTLVPKQAADDTYFAVQGHTFGYFGLQQVRAWPIFQGRVVFSMWDQPENRRAQVEECGNLTVCTRFGNEGTGVKTFMNFHTWRVGKEYGFLTRAFDLGDNKIRYEGYLHASELGGWHLLSKLVVDSGEMPWWISSMYSFIEQWSPWDCGDARWGEFGPAFVQFETDAHEPSVWSQVRRATFMHTGHEKEDLYNMSANVTSDRARWGLGIGSSMGVHEVGKQLVVESAEEIPKQLREFDHLVGWDRLPRGCPGNSCENWWMEMWTEAWQPSNFPVTCVACLIAILSCCVCILTLRIVLDWFGFFFRRVTTNHSGREAMGAESVETEELGCSARRCRREAPYDPEVALPTLHSSGGSTRGGHTVLGGVQRLGKRERL